MAPKPGRYAVIEGIQQEMQRDSNLSLWWWIRPTAVSPLGKVIDLHREFGQDRVPMYTPIDEEWFVGAAAGAAMSGVPCIANPGYMCMARAFDLVFNQIGKLRHMTGGQASMPFVLWQDGAGRTPGMAGQHSDAGQEALFAGLPGVKVVVPSNPHDAKGLMISAIRDPDPVIFYHYGSINRVRTDVPDDAYALKIGEANIVQEGSDITIVGIGPSMADVNSAAATLKGDGVSVEVVDIRSIKPMPAAQIAASVRKTGKLLVVDHGHETMGASAEIIARAAIDVPGAKFARLAFPDAPPPGNREMIQWMTPDADRTVAAAKKMVAA